MVKKNYSKTGKICRVTFKHENETQAQSAVLTGDFNHWSTDLNPMKKLRDGSFSVTLSLAAGNTYAFRYILDGSVWANETQADGYIENDYGEENSLIQV